MSTLQSDALSPDITCSSRKTSDPKQVGLAVPDVCQFYFIGDVTVCNCPTTVHVLLLDLPRSPRRSVRFVCMFDGLPLHHLSDFHKIRYIPNKKSSNKSEFVKIVSVQPHCTYGRKVSLPVPSIFVTDLGDAVCETSK